jgi:hypothetical protein
MTSTVRIASSMNSSMWHPKAPGNDAFYSNSCSVAKLATLPLGLYREYARVDRLDGSAEIHSYLKIISLLGCTLEARSFFSSHHKGLVQAR